MIALGHVVGAAALVLVSSGVGIDPAAIAAAVDAGAEAEIGHVEVRNPGTDRTAYRMFAQSGPNGLEVDAEWFRFEPATFELAPGSSRSVAVSVTVPGDVPGGDYSALLTAAVVSDAGDGTARISGAVATTARLTVRSEEGTTAPWLVGALVLAAGLLVGLVIARRRHRADAAPSTEPSTERADVGRPARDRGAV